ncbi:hypothetical protein K4F52_007235 [Lecanicillium sp. MT-2017a]|nr:hypothetical protein K4F52_007235 [Lecanicillium sp. MT-2017a]
MKGTIASLLLAGISASWAKPSPQSAKQASEFASAQALQADSAPNAVSMETVMSLKEHDMGQMSALGAFDPDRYQPRGFTPCVDGKAAEYSCKNVNLQSFLRIQDIGGDPEFLRANDIWGWTSADGREFAIVGLVSGTSFVEVMPDGKLRYVGHLPTQTESSIWRDMKVIGDHVYIGSEAKDHGLQIFDLKKLLKVQSCMSKTYRIEKDLTAHFSGFGSSHNIVANEATNTIFAVGTSRKGKCAGGAWMVDVSDPRNPVDTGCIAEDGYTHDAQCLMYNGPDTKYNGQEICFNYNEDTLTIVDATDRENPKQLSRITYNGAAYSHQGWLTTSDMRYLLLDDELDEKRKTGPAADEHTATYIVDVSSLENPFFTGVYKAPMKSIDHNLYVIDGIAYQSNYMSGLRVIDVNSLENDPTGAGIEEIAYFDVHPEDDDIGGEANFGGAWSVYPYFKSGNIVVNSIERGLFSLKLTV